MNKIEIFNKIRDIPYRIPLKWGEEDNCCSGKSEKLFDLLTKEGYEVRYRVCIFLWESINLPEELQKIPHDKDCTHTFLEIKIDGEWKVLDSSWDKGLKNIFHVNEWDGKSDTQTAVKPIKILSPEKSLEIVNEQDEEVITKDLEINGEFYKAFNEWLEKNRV